MNLKPTRRGFLVGGLAGSVGLATTLTSRSALAQSRTLRLSHHLPPGHLVDVASKRFAELVSQKTDGAVTVKVFPSGQLAGLRQGAEAVQVGTVDLVWTDFGTLANWKPEYGFVSLPFLFKDADQFKAVFKGKVGEDLRKDVKANLNTEMLGYGLAGFRVVATRNKPVREPKDLVDVRIRVPEIPIYISSFKAVHSNPTPLAWGEVYTALQTGVIDAVENPAEGLYTGDIQEVTKHLSKTHHIMTDVNLAMNAGVLSGLSGDQQDAVRSAAGQAVDEYNAASLKADDKFLKELSAKMTVIDNPDREAFRKAMKPVWGEFVQSTGDAGQAWIDRVTSVGG